MRRLLLSLLVLTACTQDFSVFQGDASASDATGSDGGGDATPTMDASGSDAGGLAFTCGAGSVSSCTSCNNMPVPCVFCGTGGALAGACIPAGMSCFNAAPSGFMLCLCGGGNPSSCPAADQVCRTGTCRTCAESINNAGYTCNGGGKCNPTDGGCI